MSKIKSKFISAPVVGATVEPLILQTNDIDRVTIAADGTVTAAAGFTDSSNRLRPLVSDTAKTATGTSVDFTGIPTWAKRITVMFNGVSTNGASFIQVQLGSGSVTTSGYICYVSYTGGANQSGGATYTSGIVTDGNVTLTAAALRQSYITIANITSNTWSVAGLTGLNRGSDYFNSIANGSIALSGTLDRLRITTVNGTDTFDAGTINIMWE